MAEKNIAFIHNYCDRWCERCSFTSRCAVYQEQESGDENLDMKNKLFWEKLAQNFTKAKSLLEDIAKRSGIDMDALAAEIEKSEDQKLRIEKLSRSHPLNQVALDYNIMTGKWLRTQPGMMQKLETMKSDLTMGIESQERARADVHTIKEALSVIEWYHHFIPPKINRAVQGKLDAQQYGEENEPQHDFNGSAKIAIIAIERSMSAWAKLFELLSEQEDHFLEILATLDRLKRELASEFPLYAAFVRPGFDEVSEKHHS